uniref:ACB domain-containing protein n=1 Tax=Bubo bubo TaxID=30461 RepID=A0A8C0ENQ0_BUBBB
PGSQSQIPVPDPHPGSQSQIPLPDPMVRPLGGVGRRPPSGPVLPPVPRLTTAAVARRDAWHSLGRMSKEEAMAAYVAEMKKVAQKVIIDTVPMDETTEEMFGYFEPLYEVIHDMPRPPEAFFKKKGGEWEPLHSACARRIPHLCATSQFLQRSGCGETGVEKWDYWGNLMLEKSPFHACGCRLMLGGGWGPVSPPEQGSPQCIWLVRSIRGSKGLDMVVQKGVGYCGANLPAAHLEVWLCCVSSRLAQQQMSFQGIFAAGV